MASELAIEKAEWLQAASLQAVFDAIETAGGEARVAGGAVRNTLMGRPVSDVDLCTTLLPGQTVKALEAASIKAVPTGFEHGTVTAVSCGQAYEITTLREDIETDGRHAVVRFGTDWVRDAERRDLTMNALYCERGGRLFDPLGGIEDAKAGLVRFIGDAEKRIVEDYLRILRFFRFFAQYGSGRPDGEGLKACARLKAGLQHISAERIWAELRKTFGADDPSRALLWMRSTGVLSEVLPESAKWGIDLLPALMEAEERFGWQADALLRLEAIIRPDGDTVMGMSRRLRLSNAEQGRLLDWAMEDPVDSAMQHEVLAKRLYRGKPRGVSDRAKLQAASAVGQKDYDNAGALADIAEIANSWKRPVFPVSGKDLIAAGSEPGAAMGKTLAAMEKRWIESGFSLSKEELLKS